MARRRNRKKYKASAGYQYKPLEPSQIRLLRFVANEKKLHCILETHDLEECPDYIALSYTWGPARFSDIRPGSDAEPKKTAAIQCDNVRLRITQNLSDACFQIRQSGENQRFWVDAICINQKDLREKTRQVALMGQIYDRASKVTVWLGLPCADLQDFIWVSENYPFSSDEAPKDANMMDKYSSVKTLLARLDLKPDDLFNKIRGFVRFWINQRWFSRIWTIQEAINSSKVEIQCGTFSVALDKSLDAGYELDARHVWYEAILVDSLQEKLGFLPPGSLSRHLVRHAVDTIKGETTQWNWKKTVDYMFEPQTRAAEGLSWLSFLLVPMRHFDSSDKRDKIFALVVLLQQYFPDALKDYIRPDYTSSVEDVYVGFATAVLNTLTPLTLLSFVDDLSNRQIPNVPSWVPHFGIKQTTNAPLLNFPKSRFYDAMQCDKTPQAPRSIQGSVFTCSGAEFDVVIRVCSATNIEIANDHRYVNLLKFCCSLPKIINEIGRVETVWRTLIGNYSPDAEEGNKDLHLAPQSMEVSFKHWLESLMFTTAIKDKSRIVYPEGCAQLLKALNSEGVSKALPDEKSISTLIAGLENDNDETWDLCQKEAQNYSNHMGPVSLARRLFQTKKGFVGMGPVSTAKDDGIFFIRDSLVPLVLRNQTRKAGILLLGECYLHGFMNGEVLEDKWGLKDRIGPVRIS